MSKKDSKWSNPVRFYHPTLSGAGILESKEPISKEYLEGALEKYCKEEYEETRSLKNLRNKRDPVYNDIRTLEKPVYLGPYEIEIDNYLIHAGLAFDNNLGWGTDGKKYAMVQNIYSMVKKSGNPATKLSWVDVQNFYALATLPLWKQVEDIVQEFAEGMRDKGVNDVEFYNAREVLTAGSNCKDLFSDTLGPREAIYLKPCSCREEMWRIKGIDDLRNLLKPEPSGQSRISGRNIDFSAAYLKFPENTWMGIVLCPENSPLRQQSTPLKTTLFVQNDIDDFS